MSVRYSELGSIAVITLDHPPVNSLDRETRAAIASNMAAASMDSEVKAIVIAGAGKIFSGGADITEFGTSRTFADPDLHEVISLIEDSSKPIVAALHGTVMGGALELALGCHYRIAGRNLSVAFPEVKLGLIPGAGGTQRLPRAVGVENALNMITKGDPVSSESLADTNLFDLLVEEREGEGSLIVLKAAVEFAEQLTEGSHAHRLLRNVTIDFANSDAYFQLARYAVKENTRLGPAQLRCVDAVSAAVSKSFEAGLAFERRCFLELLETSESRALRHAFLAERAANKINGATANLETLRAVNSAAVIGSGMMGTGIAMSFSNAGIPVMILDMDPATLQKGFCAIRKNYEESARKGRITASEVAKRMELISPVFSYSDIKEADFVVEAVFEELEVKKKIFKKLDEVMKVGSILASNTSTLDIDAIASVTSRPEDVLGMHFFSPANVMKLIEVVKGRATSINVLSTAMRTARRLNKIGVVAGVCDGFIGNRMIEQYLRQAFFLLEEGALPQQVDQAIEGFGFAMGPFRMSDLAGNDIGWAIRKRRSIEAPEMIYSSIPDRLCEMGRFGQKTSAGWYDYVNGSRNAVPANTVDAMIFEESRKIGIARREITEVEIVERLVFSLINEGAKILEEGIAQRASDIDVVYLAGYGFPRYRGGPMYYADTVGLSKVLRAISVYSKGHHGEAWVPAPLLIRLVYEGGLFNS